MKSGIQRRKIWVRKRYWCLKCEKMHGRAAIQKWYKHKPYRGQPPKQVNKIGE